MLTYLHFIKLSNRLTGTYRYYKALSNYTSNTLKLLRSKHKLPW